MFATSAGRLQLLEIVMRRPPAEHSFDRPSKLNKFFVLCQRTFVATRAKNSPWLTESKVNRAPKIQEYCLHWCNTENACMKYHHEIKRGPPVVSPLLTCIRDFVYFALRSNCV
jgi:hypothetical protein